MKLVHLVGFIIKKFATMHGHMKVKKMSECYGNVSYNLQVPNYL